MKTLFALAAICLATSALAMTTSEITMFVEKTQESPFGKTLWGTIELELSNGAPGDYLVSLLKKMRTTLFKDIVSANKTHEAYQAKAAQDIATLAGEIRLNARNIIESKRIISKSQQKLSWDRQQREQDRKHRVEAQETLNKARAVRKSEAAVYAQKIKELNDALLVLHQGKSVLEAGLLAKGASFAQVASTFEAYLNKMTVAVNQESYAGRGYVSVIARVAELISLPKIQADQGQVKKIIAMIQAIIDEIESAKSIETRIENERISNYHQIRDISKKRIADLSAAIEKLTNQIRNLKRIIAYNHNRISESTRNIQVKGRQKLKLKKEKRLEQSSFIKGHGRRQADFDLAAQADNIIKENLDEFRKIVLQNAKGHVGASYKGNTAEKVAKEKKNPNAKDQAYEQSLKAVHVQNFGGPSEREARFGKRNTRGD